MSIKKVIHPSIWITCHLQEIGKAGLKNLLEAVI